MPASGFLAGPNTIWRWVETHPARTKRHTAPHRHRVVGKTLVVAGDQRSVHRLARLEPIGCGEQSLVHLAPQTIHLVVFGLVIALMGPSRIYLGQHWFSDVMGAYVLGSDTPGDHTGHDRSDVRIN